MINNVTRLISRAKKENKLNPSRSLAAIVIEIAPALGINLDKQTLIIMSNIDPDNAFIYKNIKQTCMLDKIEYTGYKCVEIHYVEL